MSDWDEDLFDEDQQEAWDAFVRHTREDTVKKMTESVFVASIVPDAEEMDIKFAVELGLSIMLDKPLLIVVNPNTPVPERLRRAADKVIECDIDTEEGRTLFAAQVKDFGIGGHKA
jgi:hypothetical protein